MLYKILLFAVIHFTVGLMSDFGKICDSVHVLTHLTYITVYRSYCCSYNLSNSIPCRYTSHIQPNWAHLHSYLLKWTESLIQKWYNPKTICKKVVYFDDQLCAFIESGKGLSGPKERWQIVSSTVMNKLRVCMIMLSQLMSFRDLWRRNNLAVTANWTSRQFEARYLKADHDKISYTFWQIFSVVTLV